MRGKTTWQARPFRLANDSEDCPEITRIAPTQNSVFLSWIDEKLCSDYAVAYRPIYSSEGWQATVSHVCEIYIKDLQENTDYEVFISRDDGNQSRTRYFRTGVVPGVVINYLHPQDPRYSFSGRALCSPSIVRTPSGSLLCTMDVFSGNAPQNLSFVFRSKDNGETWHYVCDLCPLFWGNLFVHKDKLYILGTNTEFGDMIIGMSNDDGETWTTPVHLFTGSSTVGCGWQQAPMPVVHFKGRIWFAVEYAGHGVQTGASVLSVSEDVDLLNPANWTASFPVPLNTGWQGAPEGKLYSIAEGNIIPNRQGGLSCLLRINASVPKPGKGFAVVLNINTENPEEPMCFQSFANLPSGYNSKTFILYDSICDKYIAVGNTCALNVPVSTRNTLSLMCSEDGMNYRIVADIINYNSAPSDLVGFQYPYFFIEEEDLFLQVRTALNGARNFHDANYSTFHRIKDFRRMFSRD